MHKVDKIIICFVSKRLANKAEMSDGDSAALELRACKPGDVAAVVSFFNENVVHTLPDNFAACIKAAAQEDGFLPGEGRIACVLALSGGELIGAVVTALWKLQDSSASGRIPFELFKAPPANAEIVVLKAIAVTPLQRRRSVGTELLRAGIRHLAMENARCAGVSTNESTAETVHAWPLC